MRRDFVWVILWNLTWDGRYVLVSEVYKAWLDGRSPNGIAFAGDYIGPPDAFRRYLNRLVGDGRADRLKLEGRHPRYRAIGPGEPRS